MLIFAACDDVQKEKVKQRMEKSYETSKAGVKEEEKQTAGQVVFYHSLHCQLDQSITLIETLHLCI